MSTNAKFPPYEMVKDDGGFEGIDVEIAQKVAEKLGLELVVDDMAFDAALQAAQTGKSDIVMAGVTVTDERKAVMDFSDSYANGVQVIIVKNGSDIKTADDLSKAGKIGTQREAGSDTDHGKRPHVARPKQTRAAKRDDGESHRQQPGHDTPEARRQPDPRGKRRGTRNEIDSQQRTARLFHLQHVGDEEEEQGRRERRGDAIGDEDEQQAPERQIGKYLFQTAQQRLA